MKIVITHLDFSAYFTDRLVYFQNYLKGKGDTSYIIEILGTSPLYPFLSVSKQRLDNFEYLMESSTYNDADIDEMDKKLTKRLDDINPDVIFSGPIALPSGAISLKWAKRHGKSVVLFDDCQKDTFIRSKINVFIKKRLYSCVDAFLCPSPAYKESMNYWGFKDAQIFYGLNAVNNEFWFSNSSSYCTDFANSYFITIGRQIPFKNLEFFLKSYLEYQGRGGKTPLLMVGNGPIHEKLLEIAQNNSAIHFETFKKPEELKELYKNAKALIVPSFKTETWGLVVNEAMCSGRYVATSKEVGCSSTLVSPENGLIFDPHDKEDIVATLDKIDNLSESQLYSCGKTAQHIIGNWGLDRFAEGLYGALKYANENHVKINLFNYLICRLWKGRLNKIETV